MMMRWLVILFLPLMVAGASWLTPWSRPRETITVSGQAQQQRDNRIARFNVTVTQTNKDKNMAMEAVNKEMDKIIRAVKDFGIAAKDLTTQNVSVNETGRPEILIYPPPPGSGEKEWQASNSLEIILRDVSQASVLTDLLQGFPLAQVSGPNFSLDNNVMAKTELFTAAVDNAREKAEQVAAASGRKLGKVISISEAGGGVYPFFRGVGAEKVAESAPVEPGSTEMSQTVTVVFELK